MQIRNYFFITGFIALLAIPALAQRYTLEVEHEHLLRNCRGTIVITPERIEYQTSEKNDARDWEYSEIRQLIVVSPVELEVVTYEDQRRMLGRDRIFRFSLLQGRIKPEISALLLEKVPHPLVTSVPPVSEGAPQISVPVRHLHAFGSCSGTLKIYNDRVVFDSLADARFWRYGDLQNFSHSERFRFEIVSYEDGFGGLKTYSFQLKEDLPAQAYDYIWSRVYPSKLSPVTSPQSQKKNKQRRTPINDGQ